MMSEKFKGEKHHNFKGQDKINLNGYRVIWVGHDHLAAYKNGYALEHRAVMADHLGRRLEHLEDVHHINGDKLDNRLENLEIIEHGKHTSRKGSAVYEDAIALHLEKGTPIEEIAERLHISTSTVRRYASAEASTITL